jgi:hypothetical protein
VRKLRTSVAVTALYLVLVACGEAGTVTRTQHQRPDGKTIKVERFCVHYVVGTEKKARVDCDTIRSLAELNKIKRGDKWPK